MRKATAIATCLLLVPLLLPAASAYIKVGEPGQDAVAASLETGPCVMFCEAPQIFVLMPGDDLIPPGVLVVYIVTCTVTGNVNVVLANVQDACPIGSMDCSTELCMAIGIPPERIPGLVPEPITLPPGTGAICHGVLNVWVLNQNVISDLNVFAPCALDA